MLAAHPADRPIYRVSGKTLATRCRGATKGLPDTTTDTPRGVTTTASGQSAPDSDHLNDWIWPSTIGPDGTITKLVGL